MTIEALITAPTKSTPLATTRTVSPARAVTTTVSIAGASAANGWLAPTAVLPSELDPGRIDGLFRIDVDEISWRRHKYLTLVVDHDRGVLIWGAQGKDAKTLDQFFDELGPQRAGLIEAVSVAKGVGGLEDYRDHTYGKGEPWRAAGNDGWAAGCWYAREAPGRRPATPASCDTGARGDRCDLCRVMTLMT